MAEGIIRLEVHEKKTMLVKEAGGAANRQPLRITGASEETSVRVAEPASPATADWWVSITSESERSLVADRSRSKPRIQRVPELLCKTEKNKEMFNPVVVALGPFHHGQLHLEAMEAHKKASAKRFAADTPYSIDMFYNKVRGVAGEARKCYAANFDLDDDRFAVMMFLDACFLLHFIDLLDNGRMKELTMSPHLYGIIIRDMFLLENQIPFIVLEAIMSLKHVDIFKFVNGIIGTPSQKYALQPGSRSAGGEQPSFHLLDLLRIRLLGPQEPVSIDGNWTAFRSATELNEVGIRFTTSETSCLRDVKFKAGYIHGYLSLPQIVIDDLTRSRLLNLIAFEMCPDGTSDYGITSYVWFLDCLIDRPDDVKELRSKKILLNALGSDEHVAELFNELATDLSPDYGAYYQAIKGINDQLSNKTRVSIVRMVHIHFSSPWTTISFIAAVFLLILTVIQTVFAVFPR